MLALPVVSCGDANRAASLSERKTEEKRGLAVSSGPGGLGNSQIQRSVIVCWWGGEMPSFEHLCLSDLTKGWEARAGVRRGAVRRLF